MYRLALNKTTRPLLYGTMGSGIIPALLPLALALGISAAQATQVTRTVSFSVPIHTPTEVCVAVNREPKRFLDLFQVRGAEVKLPQLLARARLEPDYKGDGNPYR